MKKLTFAILTLITVTSIFTSCLKSDVNTTPLVQPAAQKDTIQKFITTKGYNMIELKDVNGNATGLMYQVLAIGDTVNNRLSNTKPVGVIKYKGTLLDDTVFDESSNAQFNFATTNFVQAFTFGATYIGKGGHIRLVTPSLYGYGSQAHGKITPNSPLFFDIELLDVKAQ